MLPGCESLMYSTNAKANMSIIITNAENNGKDNYVIMSTDLKFSLGFCFVFVVRFFWPPHFSLTANIRGENVLSVLTVMPLAHLGVMSHPFSNR